MLGAAGLQTFIPVAAHRVGGQCDDRCSETTVAELPRSFITVHHWHLHVHHHGINRFAGLLPTLNQFDPF